jgi:hypothetical protein
MKAYKSEPDTIFITPPTVERTPQPYQVLVEPGHPRWGVFAVGLIISFLVAPAIIAGGASIKSSAYSSDDEDAGMAIMATGGILEAVGIGVAIYGAASKTEPVYRTEYR